MRFFSVLFAILFAGLFIAAIIANVTYTFVEYKDTFTITGKSVVNKDDSVVFMVFTDKTTYKVADTWVHRRWDSADFYGKLEIGKTYNARLQGFRAPFFSILPNIIEVVEVPVSAEDN